jgi:hypothetical protein
VCGFFGECFWNCFEKVKSVNAAYNILKIKSNVGKTEKAIKILINISRHLRSRLQFKTF